MAVNALVLECFSLLEQESILSAVTFKLSPLPMTTPHEAQLFIVRDTKLQIPFTWSHSSIPPFTCFTSLSPPFIYGLLIRMTHAPSSCFSRDAGLTPTPLWDIVHGNKVCIHHQKCTEVQSDEDHASDGDVQRVGTNLGRYSFIGSGGGPLTTEMGHHHTPTHQGDPNDLLCFRRTTHGRRTNDGCSHDHGNAGGSTARVC
jgi:hypothetical protein